MNEKLKQSGYLAIPLKQDIESTLNPYPNWYVIDDVQGKVSVNLPMLGDTICAHSKYKIVYREILEENIELGRVEEMREVIYESSNQPIPLGIIPALSSHQTLLHNVSYINLLLSMFQFRGILNNIKLEIDTELLNNIVYPILPTPTPTISNIPSITLEITETPTPTPTQSVTSTIITEEEITPTPTPTVEII